VRDLFSTDYSSSADNVNIVSGADFLAYADIYRICFFGRESVADTFSNADHEDFSVANDYRPDIG